MPIEHSDIGLGEIHIVHNWEYANATARNAASGFIASDVGKWAKQLDDGTFWELTAVTPTWAQRTGAGALANDSITNALLANMAQATIKGRASGAGTGDPTDLTPTEVKTLLAIASTDVSDFAEAVEDRIGAKVVAGTGISVAYNDTTGETTITNNDPGSGVSGAPADATYITQTPSGGLSNEQAMSALASGLVKNTTTTGVQSIATAADVSAPLYAVDSVGSDAYAITLSPAIAAYTDGMLIAFKAGTANTGAATLAVNGLAAKAIVKSAGGLSTALADNDIRAGQIVIVQYSSAADNFQMQSTLGNASGGGGTPGGSSGDIQYNNGGSFGAAPLVREDADTVGLYDTSNTSENPSRLNIYGLKNGSTFERWSMYYNTSDDCYVLDINHSSGSLRRLEIKMGGTNYWTFRTDGKIYAASNTDSILSVAEGSSTVPGLQLGTSGGTSGLSFNSGPFLNLMTGGARRLSVHDFGAVLGSASRLGFSSAALNSSQVDDTALERETGGRLYITDGSTHNLRDLKVRQHYVDATMTGAGTTGAQTINKSAGSVNFAAGANSLVVTNNLVSTSSIVIATIQTDDATATSVKAIPASGSFTLKLNANATAETKVAFVVINK